MERKGVKIDINYLAGMYASNIPRLHALEQERSYCLGCSLPSDNQRQAEEIKAKSEYINTLHLLISNHSQNCRGWFGPDNDAWEAMINALRTKTEVKDGSE